MLAGMFLINFQSFDQSKKDTLQYHLNLSLSGRKISGTFNQLVAGGGFQLDLLYKHWHLENKTTYRFNKTNGRVIEDNWYDLISLKYYIKGNQKLYPGIFYHYDNNLMYRVKNRHQYGFGLGSVLDKGKMQLSILALLAKEHSTFNGFDFANSELDFSVRKNGLFLFKLNNGFSFAKKKVHFSYQLFYFQSLKESKDFDLWVTARLNFNVIKDISFHVVYDYRFENVHLNSLSNYNDIILFGFNWTFSSTRFARSE